MTFKENWEKADSIHELSSEAIYNMVASAYPSQKLISYKLISGGCINLNFKINIENVDGALLLRVYTRDQDASYREKGIAELVKEEVPVPQVHYIGTWGKYTFSIVDFISGITLRDLLLGDYDYNLEAVMFDVGTVLSNISKYKFISPGFFDNSMNIMKDSDNRDYLEYARECLTDSFVSAFLPVKTIDRIDKFLVEHDSMLSISYESNLVHADFDPANILMSEGAVGWFVSGMLDWEFAFSGSSMWDISNMLRYSHQMPKNFEEGFISGVYKNGMVLPENWRVGVKLLNLISLLDCLRRSRKENYNKNADIKELVDDILSEAM